MIVIYEIRNRFYPKLLNVLIMIVQEQMTL